MNTKTSNDKYIQQQVKERTKHFKELEKFVKTIVPPSGFTATWIEDDFYRDPNYKNYVLTNEDAKIKFTFRPGGSGSTSFFVYGRGWLTFDRHGVEDSFYYLPLWKGDKRPPVSEMLSEQLTRIEERRKYYTNAIIIPEIGHSVSPEGLAKMKEAFKKSKTAYQSFYPSGFGTGYVVSRKPGSFAKRAVKELEDFIGIAPLYVSTFDAD